MAEPPHKFFTKTVIENRLGAYVYALLDPRSEPHKVFYVGKAGGRDGQGNTRPDGHLFETAEALATESRLSEKQQIIADIWKGGREPVLAIVRRQFDPENATAEGMAFEVEAALIEMLQRFFGAAQGNKVSGRHESDRGLLIGRDIELIVSASTVSPSYPIDDVWLFNISNAVGGQRNLDDAKLYEMVRGDWAIGLPSKAGFAVGLVGGVARIVCRVDQWRELTEKSGRVRRTHFEGKVLGDQDDIGRELLHKDFTAITDACPAWLFGKPLRVNFDGQGRATPDYNGPPNSVIDLPRDQE